jgi:hypothetical protein
MTPIEPVVLPGSNNPDMTDHVCGIALREKAFFWWRVAFAPAALLTSVLVGSMLYLFYAGVGIWGIDWAVAWGFAISTTCGGSPSPAAAHSYRPCSS